MPWQIDVYTPDGHTLRRTLTPEDPVHSVSWSVRGDGDCLEGAITGTRLDLRAREIVVIRAKARPTDAGQPAVRYVGWVVEQPAARAPGLTTCRLVGGRKRLSEILTRNYLFGEASVDIVAYAAANALNVLANPRLVRPAASYPSQTFVAGQRFPTLETLSETLEAYAAMVPEFTVEPATTYAYNGRTYQPGDQVPATRFGVRAEAANGGRGTVYFERPNPTPATLNEVNDRLSIEWRPREAETVVDDVTVVVLETNNADSVSSNLFGLVPSGQPALSRPVIHREQLAGSPYGAELRVGSEGEGLTTAAFTAAPVTLGWTNGANAFDGNPSTYASNTDDPINNLARRAEAPAIIWRVRYSSHVAFSVDVYRLEGLVATRHIWSLPSTNGNQVERYLHAPPLQSYAEASITFRIPRGAIDDDIRVYEATPLKPDPDVLGRLARSYMRLPDSAPAASITVPNRILNPNWRWTLQLADGDNVTGVAEQIDYVVSADEGLTTTIHLEQALTPGETAARALLDTKISRAVRAGTKPTA